MLKPDPKAEAFAIKMEELMKQALSGELQEMSDGDEDQPVDLATDDNDETLTEEEMIQIVKKEPNEKPLFVRDFVASRAPAEEEELDSQILESDQDTDLYHQYILPQPSQTQNEEHTQDNEEHASESQHQSALVPDTSTSPEPEPQTAQVRIEPARMDLEAMYEESLIDTKSTSIAKGEYYTSVECKSCQIIFNDNYGFRRHLSHFHPQDRDETATYTEEVPQENPKVRRSLRSRSMPATSTTTTATPSPPKALHKKNPKCNVKFKRQFRANLKLKHIKTIPLPEAYEKPVVDIQCRFCPKGGWKESEYRLHLVQRHSRELNPLSKQIADSNSERLKETEATTSSTPTNNTASTSNRLSTTTIDSYTTADPDITMLEIPYDPIKDISENQRRTYQFFQNYMLDIS